MRPLVKVAAFFFMKIQKEMKYKINKYQTIYSCGSRDTIKLDCPIYTNNIETVRAKLKMKHSVLGMKCIGVNLDYVELNEDKQ